MIWIDASLSYIQIQKTEDYYSEQSSTNHLVAMRFSTDDGPLYVIDVYDEAADAEMFAHIQDNFKRLVEEVDVQAIILERSKCFDSHLLRLLAAFVEKKKQFSIRVHLDYSNVTFEVWRAATTSTAAYEQRQQHICLVNIQPSYDKAREHSENKLRVGISTIDGCIRSIMIDEVEVRDLDILKKRLFGAGGYWGKVLKSLLNQLIENEGMEIFGDTLKIHPLAIKLFPEKVLASYLAREFIESDDQWEIGGGGGDLMIKQIQFLKENDLTESVDGSDMGGLTKQFLTELGQNLFDGNSGRSIRVDSNFIPYIPSREDAGSTDDEFGFVRDAAINFGKLLCRLKDGECLSRVISDNFFGILQIHIRNLETDELSDHGSDVSIKLNKLIFTDSVYEPLVRFLYDDERTGINREKALDILEHRDIINSTTRSLHFPLLKYSKLRSGFFSKVPLRKSFRTYVDVKELTSKMRQIIDLEREPYMRMAQLTFEGLNDKMKDLFGYGTYKKNSEKFQGLNLDARDIISRIRFDDTSRGNSVIFEKVGYLTDYILKRASTEWIENFLLCVTGQRNLNAGTHINIGMTTGLYCCSHTCTNTLDISRTHETPPLAEASLYLRFIQNLEFLLAQSRRFDIV